MVDPYTDELASQHAATTPSVVSARAADVTPTLLRRPYAPSRIRAHEESVTHAPLYFEDPFVDRASEDSQSAWTSEDYLCLFYGPSRFLLNGLFFPVSAVATPPWVVMASDGRPSRSLLGMDQDAERWVEPADLGVEQDSPPDTATE